MGRKNQDTILPVAGNFPVITEGYEPSLLRRDYLQLLQKDPAVIEPVLVLRGVHALARGLLEHNQPSEIDADFASKSYIFFHSRGSRRQDAQTIRPRRRGVEQKAAILRRGWSLLIAEDVLGMVSIIDAKRRDSRLDMGVPHHRAQAHDLFTVAGDDEGMFVNATQELFCERMRGARGLLQMPTWLGRVAFASEKIGVRIKKDYTPARFNTMSSRSIAELVFLSNIFSHDGRRIVG